MSCRKGEATSRRPDCAGARSPRSQSRLPQDATSTASIHRDHKGLVEHLVRGDRFPYVAVLSTGTGLVPGMDFTLRDADVVSISIDGIGTLTNTVRVGVEPFGWIPAPSPLPQPVS